MFKAGENDRTRTSFGKYYVPIVTLSAKDNQKLSKLPSKGFERPVCLSEYERKSESKNLTNNYRYFIESNFVGLNRFVLNYLNRDNDVKKSLRLEILFTKRYYQ